ncbi:MAG: histidine phosphatase family protein [Leptolyngbyaceae cyanobacterium MO_188.B28]|nr:histidine phosphatase family protein [Leptolyngbyaceae cyanobacterium MO_188.B28]
MTLYLIRHGETQWNRAGRLQGHGDSPLTMQGIEQAIAAVQVLQRDIDNLVDVQLQTSPLFRARQTAAIIADGLGLSPDQCLESPLLIEHNFGKWEGLTDIEIEALYPGAQTERHRNHWSYMVPGGESYAQVYQRAKQWFQLPRLASTTIVLTHAKTSRALRGVYLNLKPEEILPLKHPQDCLYKLQANRIESYSYSSLPRAFNKSWGKPTAMPSTPALSKGSAV